MSPVGSVHDVDVVVVGLGGIGSAAAWQLARRGVSVVGLEQFELGHMRGASHDTSRILRRYHTPGYVRLAGEAYGDWSDLEHAAGEQLVTRTGGVDLFPPGAAIPVDDYATSMTAEGVPFEVLGAADVSARWPAMRAPDGTFALWQEDTSVVPAGRTTRVLQRLAAGAGAQLLDCSPVVALEPHDDGTVGVRSGGARPAAYRARHVVLAADAWTGDLLGHLGTTLPLTVTREQVTYYRPDDPAALTPPALPVWIWMDDPSYYGFPVYDEPGSAGLVKAGQDVGGHLTTADGRTFEPDIEAETRLTDFVTGLLPGAGPAERTVTCLYTLTPDRDFVLDRLPKHPAVVVGLGAGHGFKFVPTFGRVLADLVTDGGTTSDLAAFAADRPALVESDHPTSWLV